MKDSLEESDFPNYLNDLSLSTVSECLIEAITQLLGDTALFSFEPPVQKKVMIEHHSLFCNSKMNAFKASINRKFKEKSEKSLREDISVGEVPGLPKFSITPPPPHCVSYLLNATARIFPSLTSTSLPHSFPHFNLLANAYDKVSANGSVPNTSKFQSGH